MKLRCIHCNFVEEEQIIYKREMCSGCGNNPQNYLREDSQDAWDDFMDSFDFVFLSENDPTH